MVGVVREKTLVSNVVSLHNDLLVPTYYAFYPNPDFIMVNDDLVVDYVVYVPRVKGLFNPVGVVDFLGNLGEIMVTNDVAVKEMVNVREEGSVINVDYVRVDAYQLTIF